eukprot:gene9423-biopygen7651
MTDRLGRPHSRASQLLVPVRAITLRCKAGCDTRVRLPEAARTRAPTNIGAFGSNATLLPPPPCGCRCVTYNADILVTQMCVNDV